MSEKFVVGYDGSDASNRALEFAVARAKSQGGSIVVAHVLGMVTLFVPDTRPNWKNGTSAATKNWPAPNPR